jgi:hypothetical protein
MTRSPGAPQHEVVRRRPGVHIDRWPPDQQCTVSLRYTLHRIRGTPVYLLRYLLMSEYGYMNLPDLYSDG